MEIKPDDENLVEQATRFGVVPGLGINRATSMPNLLLQQQSPRKLSAPGSLRLDNISRQQSVGSLQSQSVPVSPRRSVSGSPRKTPVPGSPVRAAVEAATSGAVRATVDNLEKKGLGETVKSLGSAIDSIVGTVLGKREKKNPKEHAEESLAPALEKTRHSVNGFEKLVAAIVGSFAANQIVSILSKPFKWIKLDLLFKKGGMIFSGLSAINEFFTPEGQKIFSDVFKAQVLNGKFQLEIGQGLYILVAALFNLFFIILVVYIIYLLFGWFYERWVHKNDFKKIEQNKRLLKSILENEKK